LRPRLQRPQHLGNRLNGRPRIGDEVAGQGHQVRLQAVGELDHPRHPVQGEKPAVMDVAKLQDAEAAKGFRQAVEPDALVSNVDSAVPLGGGSLRSRPGDVQAAFLPEMERLNLAALPAIGESVADGRPARPFHGRKGWDASHFWYRNPKNHDSPWSRGGVLEAYHQLPRKVKW
jgi:hypothetical protein